MVSLSSITGIYAKASSFIGSGFIKISTKVPVTPNGSKFLGYSVDFRFIAMGRFRRNLEKERSRIH